MIQLDMADFAIDEVADKHLRVNAYQQMSDGDEHFDYYWTFRRNRFDIGDMDHNR